MPAGSTAGVRSSTASSRLKEARGLGQTGRQLNAQVVITEGNEWLWVLRPVRPLTGGNHRSQGQVATQTHGQPLGPHLVSQMRGQTGPLGATKWDWQRAEPRIAPHFPGPRV